MNRNRGEATNTEKEKQHAARPEETGNAIKSEAQKSQAEKGGEELPNLSGETPARNRTPLWSRWEREAGRKSCSRRRTHPGRKYPPHMRARVHAGRMRDGGGEMGWIHKGAGEANGNGGNGRGGGQPTES